MKRMRFSVVSLIGAILIVFYNLAFAAPQTISFQGVLRTTAGAPVPDASYDATFSLYDTPTGGVPIWTETQPVTTTGGLFTCELGAFADLLDSYVHQIDDGARYLQIQVVISGTPVIMSPRTHLTNVPSALTASSIHATHMSGSTTGTIRMVATGDSVSEMSTVGNGLSGSSIHKYLNNENCEWTLQCPTGFSSVTTSSTGTGHVLSGHSGSTTGTIRMMATGDSVVEESGMENGASSKQYYNNEHCVWDIQCPSISGSTTGTIRMEATGDSAGLSVQQGADVPGNHRDGWNLLCADGMAEMTGSISSGLPPGEPVIDNMRLRIDALSSSVAINQKGTGADKNRVIMESGPDGPSVGLLDSGSVENGSIDYRIVNDGVGKRADVLMRIVLLGLPPGEPVEDNIALGTDGTSSRLAIKTKGTSAHRSSATMETLNDHEAALTVSQDDGTIKTFHWTQVSGPSVFTETAVDDDDDDEGDVGSRCDAEQNRATLKTYFETGEIPTDNRSSVMTTADASGATMEMQARLNGLPPGEPVIGTLSLTTTGTSAGIAIGDPGTNEFRTTSSEGSTSASTSNRFGSGPRQTTSMDGSYDHARMECATDVDNDGTPDVGTQTEAKVPRAVLKSYYQTADKPTQSQFITVADSSGTNTEMQTRLNGLPPGEPVIGTLSMTTSSSSATLAMGNPESKNIGLYVSSTTGQCMMTMMDDGGGGVGSTPETTIVIDAHTKRLGIGVSQPSHPIDHSSGAKLTTAGDWVNASSQKLKENFEAVNGAEVLEKIEDLSVTRWNYKTDDDNITHIGPTAEEFHDAFGIGESDKAISTIDPSGVALVAIKELSKRNKQLDKQNEQLQKQLDDLQKAVDKLVKQAEKSR